jgi:hypothetical protein
LLIQNAKSDVFEVSDCAGLIVVEHILRDNMDQQNVLFIDFLLILLDPIGEWELFVPA